MSEREPRDIAKIAQWSVDRLAARMGSVPEPTADDDYGAGAMLAAPDTLPPASNEQRFISLFPETSVVTIASKNVDVTVRNATVRESQSGIHVETEDGSSRVLFLRDGHVAVEILPPVLSEPLEASTTAVPTPEQPTGLLPPSGVSQAVSAAPESPTSEPSETPQTAEQKEKQPRVKFTGRLGADPHYEDSPKSGLITRFPVAEQTSDDQATWHRVYSTGKSAERIKRAELGKGDKVTVDGYRQERDQQRRDGTTVKQEVVFAVHVRKLGARSEPGHQLQESSSHVPSGERRGEQD